MPKLSTKATTVLQEINRYRPNKTNIGLQAQHIFRNGAKYGLNIDCAIAQRANNFLRNENL
jgi:hypothetical protein